MGRLHPFGVSCIGEALRDGRKPPESLNMTDCAKIIPLSLYKQHLSRSFMDPIKVTCAIIQFGDKILVVQRSAHMRLPLKWEFPGGKVEVGESEEACILREIREELNIDIELVARHTPARFDYPDFSILLIPFTANYLRGTIKLAEHKQYLLLEKARLSALDWAEADLPVLEEFLSK